jgi:hypothetical protein
MELNELFILYHDYHVLKKFNIQNVERHIEE